MNISSNCYVGPHVFSFSFTGGADVTSVVIPPHLILYRLDRQVMIGSQCARQIKIGYDISLRIHPTRNSNLEKGKGPC